MSEVQTFEPGTRILDLGLARPTEIAIEMASVVFPNRIHMTPIDCNRFQMGHPGGGGIGFAIDTKNSLSIARSEDTCVRNVEPRNVPLVLHWHRVMQKLLCGSAHFRFGMKESPLVDQHCGLGSSVAVACGIVAGINELYGCPFTVDELRTIIAHNFVEEYQGSVARGLETGVGTSVILHGGLSVIGGEIIEIFHSNVSEDLCMLLIKPQVSRPHDDKPESTDMLSRSVYLDTSYRYIKAYNLIMEIVPALRRGDYSKLGDHIWDIQFSGTHQSMIQSYSEHGLKLYSFLCALRSMGATVVGISSVGPAIYAWYPRERMKSACTELGNKFPGLQIHTIEFCNAGTEVTLPLMNDRRVNP